MNNQEFLNQINLDCEEPTYAYAKKLVAVAEAAKEYVDDRTFNIGTWKLEETLKEMERE